MNRLVLCSTFALVASAVQAPAFAQIVPPQPIAAGQTIEAALQPDAPRLEDGVPFGCYAIETAPGDRVAVVLHSQSFHPVVRIARGALCSASALQQESDPANTSSEARVEFAAAGGRYLILARASASNASGQYALSVEGATTVRAERIATTNTDAERQRIMRHEVAQRQAQLAAEAERKRREAEAARRAMELAVLAAQQAEEDAYYEDEYYDDYSAPQTNTMAGIMNAFVDGYNAETQKQRQMQAQFDETRRMIARQQAEARRRQLEEQRERYRQESAQRAAASMSSGGSSYSPGLIIEDAKPPAPTPRQTPPTPRPTTSSSSAPALGNQQAPSKPAPCPTVTKVQETHGLLRKSRDEAMRSLTMTPRTHAVSDLYDIQCSAHPGKQEFWSCRGKYRYTVKSCNSGASRQ